MYATLVAKPMDTGHARVAIPKMIVVAGTWHWVRRAVPPAGIRNPVTVAADVALGLALKYAFTVPALVITRSLVLLKFPVVGVV